MTTSRPTPEPLWRRLLQVRLAWLVTAASCAFLAWAAHCTLAPALQRSAAEPADYRITFEEGEPLIANANPVRGLYLFVDGWPVQRQRFDLTGTMRVTGEPPELVRTATPGPAVIEFRARTASIRLLLDKIATRMTIERNGEVTVQVDLPPSNARVWRRWYDVHSDPPSPWWLPAFLALFGSAAAVWRPWLGERRALGWVLMHTAVLQLLHWVALPVGAHNDSAGYVDNALRLSELRATYFPPGYPLALAPLLPTGDLLAATATLLQAGLCTITALWLFAILRRAVALTPAVAGTLVAVSAASFMMMGRSMMTEAMTAWAAIGSIWFLLRQRESGRSLHGVAAGVLAAFGGALRVTPLPVLAVLFIAVHARRPWRTAIRRAAVPTGVALGPILLLMLVARIGGSDFTLASSVGSHLFNSVVTAKRLFHAEGEVSSTYADAVLGEYVSLGGQKSVRMRLRKDHGLDYSQSQEVLRQIAVEALVEYPFRFAGRTLEQSWSQLFRPPSMQSYPTLSRPTARLVSPPPLEISAPAMQWRRDMFELERWIWPICCWLFLGGCAAACFMAGSVGVLALGAMVVGMVIVPSALEFPIDRYSAPGAPALLAIAVSVPLHLLSRAVRRLLEAGSGPS